MKCRNQSIAPNSHRLPTHPAVCYNIRTTVLRLYKYRIMVNDFRAEEKNSLIANAGECR